MGTFEVKWNDHNDEYYVNIPIDSQTLHMSFWLDDWNDRSVRACKEFCCEECDYRVYAHKDYILRCVRRLMIDVDKILNGEKKNDN